MYVYIHQLVLLSIVKSLLRNLVSKVRYRTYLHTARRRNRVKATTHCSTGGNVKMKNVRSF